LYEEKSEGGKMAMKRRWIFTGILALLFLALPGDAFSKSKENKAACEKWCNANKPRCAFCDSAVFCKGRTYDVIKSFKKGTGNWYACGLSEYGRESLNNKDECIRWCHAHKNDKWPHDTCLKCSTAVGCGKGYHVLKRFTGKGKNWHACGFKDSRRQCEAYCAENKPKCEFCSANPGCGAGYKSMKKFQGLTVDDMTNSQIAERNYDFFTYLGDALEYFKKNWHACKKK
jgi:hypothetical protein